MKLMLHWLANPARFMRLSSTLLPWFTGLTAVTLAIGLYLTFFFVPEDYQQGSSVRIMYIHVPSAWMSLFTYSFMAIASIGALIWRHPLADVAARAAAPIGACFTALCLMTGSIWGRPMWGTWWEWDGRMTSTLVLLFLYFGYMALWDAIEDRAKAARAAAILAIVGWVNIPIIKFSVDWWNTLHQPASVFRLDGPTIHGSMLWPLLIMAVAFNLYFVVVLLMRMRAEINGTKLAALRRRAALQA